jgi:hypothetical protein
MLFLKNICLIIFTIITILFTVGYASQPIVTSSASSGAVAVNNTIYIYKNTDYSNLSNNVNKVYTLLLALCIASTVLLVLSIILALTGLKLISKIVLFFILIMMIIVFLIIQIKVLANSIITMVDAKNVNTFNNSNGAGYYLILASTILMFVNYILYAIFA